MAFFADMVRTAELSPDQQYRYSLTRLWDRDRPCAYYIMLNPSRADALKDDPTLRKCIGFATRREHGGVKIANLFAYRAVRPDTLWRVKDPIGPETDVRLQRFIAESKRTGGTLICAWGANAPAYREEAIRQMLRVAEVAPFCYGRAKQGQPFHPLLLPYSAALQPYPIFKDR